MIYEIYLMELFGSTGELPPPQTRQDNRFGLSGISAHISTRREKPQKKSEGTGCRVFAFPVQGSTSKSGFRHGEHGKRPGAPGTHNGSHDQGSCSGKDRGKSLSDSAKKVKDGESTFTKTGLLLVIANPEYGLEYGGGGRNRTGVHGFG